MRVLRGWSIDRVEVMSDTDVAWLLGGILLVVLVVGAGVYWLWPFEVEARVTAQQWERGIAVERWQENTREGWDVPPGGVVVGTDRRARSTDRYQCGTDSEGDPRWCSRTVYDDWYTFRVWEWTRVREFVASGSTDPYWPDASDIASTDPMNPERLGAWHDRYTTWLISRDGVSYQVTTSLAVWETLAIETTHRLKVNRAGTVLGVTE